MEGTCSFEGCTNKLLCKGLCLAHYTQQRRGKPLTPITTERKWAKRDENGKECTKCKTYKPYEEFHNHKNGSGGKMPTCKECHIEIARRNYEKHRKGFVPTYRDENGKVCRGCEEYKPYTEYYVDRSAKDGKQTRCGSCQSKAGRESYKRKQLDRKQAASAT
jgi:hypothetical protein